MRISLLAFLLLLINFTAAQAQTVLPLESQQVGMPQSVYAPEEAKKQEAEARQRYSTTAREHQWRRLPRHSSLTRKQKIPQKLQFPNGQ